MEISKNNVPVHYPQTVYGDDEIDLLELWNVIWGGRKFITLFTGTCTMIAILVAIYILPVTYQSVAVLQPVAAGQSSLGKLSSLAGGLPSMLGISSGDGNGQQLVDFLSSRNFQQRLIENYDLLQRWSIDAWDAEHKKWRSEDSRTQPSVIKALQTKNLNKYFSLSTASKTGLITLTWTEEDPQFAAQMLERIIDELKHYLKFEYVTDAQRERVFTEAQLKKSREELEYWEAQVPNAKFTQGAIQRELIAGQLVYQELRKQFELAKIQESKQVISFKVLDKPFIPEIKYGPKRALFCAANMMGSGFLSVLIVFIWRRYKEGSFIGRVEV